jgi:hypothetical protein
METVKSPAPEPQAATTGLDFSAALSELKKGKKIRRPLWPAGVYLSFDSKYKWPDEKVAAIGCITHVRNGESSRFSLHERDILAKDWELVD